jgi:hypothetical protein
MRAAAFGLLFPLSVVAGCTPAPASRAQPSDAPLSLAWIVRPGDPKDRRVELRVAVDGTEQRLALGPPQQGALLPENQSVCDGPQYAKERDEIAKITFYEAGAGGYAVRRGADGAFAVVAWAQDDGACPDDAGDVQACPVEERVVAKPNAPGGRRVVESLRLLDARGGERAYDCARGDER